MKKLEFVLENDFWTPSPSPPINFVHDHYFSANECLFRVRLGHFLGLALRLGQARNRVPRLGQASRGRALRPHMTHFTHVLNMRCIMHACTKLIKGGEGVQKSFSRKLQIKWSHNNENLSSTSFWKISV